jgi:hypothetical protein
MDQNLVRKAHHCDYQVTVRAVEGRAHLNLFPALPQPRQDSVETAPGRLAPRLAAEIPLKTAVTENPAGLENGPVLRY